MTEETPPLVTNSDDNPWILRIFPNPDPHRTGTSPSYLWGTISYHPHNVRDPESTTSGILSPQRQGSWVRLWTRDPWRCEDDLLLSLCHCGLLFYFSIGHNLIHVLFFLEWAKSMINISLAWWDHEKYWCGELHVAC